MKKINAAPLRAAVPRAVYLLTAALLAALPLMFSSCSDKTYTAHTLWAMDTAITIKIDSNQADSDDIFSNCDTILSSVDALLSRTNAGSDVSRINMATGGIEISDAAAAVISTALEVSELTKGCFDITVLPYVLMWEECGRENRLPDEAYLLGLRAAAGYDKLRLKGNTLTKLSANTRIDLGGIGKGYAADRVVEYLISAGVSYGLVSFGSSVAVFGEKPGGGDFKIGIKDPSDTSDVVGYIYMSSGALSVSGDYERFVEIGGVRYHHLLNPADGYPEENGLHSVAVLSRSGAVADALSTALFVMGKDAALELYRSGKISFEAILIGDDGITLTDGLDGKFEYAPDKR